MIGRLTDLVVRRVDRLCAAYAPPLTYLGALRILFGLYVLVRPVPYGWMAGLPDAFFQPPPGPFLALSGPPSHTTIVVLAGLRTLLAVLILVGYRTRFASCALTVTLVVGSGYLYSFGRVDHLILFELLPAVMAWAGWGDRLSLDHRLVRVTDAREVGDGLPMLVWGMTISMALLTAAGPKVFGGWLSPGREAIHGYVARDVAEPSRIGLLARAASTIDSHLFWKALDLTTVFAEGWLFVALLSPLLFRLGLVLLLVFHVSVFLMLQIDFESYTLVYLPFFAPPLLALVRRRRSKMSEPLPSGVLAS